MGRVPIIVGSGLLGLLFLIGVTLGDPQEASDGVGPLDEPAALAVTETPDVPATGDPAAAEEEDQQVQAPVVTPAIDLNLDTRARAVRIDKDGFVFGYVHYVDPHTLEQAPVPGAVITFMQNCHIAAQAKSGADGRFAVKGLSPYAVYSMFVRADLWVCMLGTYVLPEDNGDVPVDADDAAAARASKNAFVFASQPLAAKSTDNVQATEGDPRFHAIQVVPLRDFICAINQGLFGDICAGASGVCCPLPTGGGGGGGAGYGGAAAAAAAAAWGGGVGGDNNELASPFRPR